VQLGGSVAIVPRAAALDYKSALEDHRT
jgi:hypothetical protein